MAREFAFGLDFGTSKTAMTWTKTGNVSPSVNDVPLDHDIGRTATCVLRNRVTGDVVIGTSAEEEFRLTPRDESDHTDIEFLANFKPHIHHDAESRATAALFLKKLAELEPVKQLLTFHGDNGILVAGCPVVWDEGARRTLTGLLNEAGFSNAYTVAEPIGAAFNFLAKSMTAKDFHRDLVIIDWGAGTFDMTVMRAGRLDDRARFGSAIYGGRLFDDLFFQWLCEIIEKEGRSVIDLKRALGDDGTRDYLQLYLSREVKENFSGYLRKGDHRREYNFPHPITIGVGRRRLNLGDFSAASPAAFEERARKYVASPHIRAWLSLSHNEVGIEERAIVEDLRQGKPVDLIAWAKLLIDSGVAALAAEKEPLAILTGGSTNWKWFEDLVRAHPAFSGKEKSIFIDGQPELTIARGLGRAYAIGIYSLGLRARVKEVTDRMFLTLRDLTYPRHLRTLVSRLSEAVTSDQDFQADVLKVFQDAVRRRPSPPVITGQSLQSAIQILQQAVKQPPFDRKAVAALLDSLLQSWLAIPKNQAEVQSAAEQFAHAAFADTMKLLETHADKDIGGLVSVAIEACSVAGERQLAEQIQQLAARVRFGPKLVERLLRGLAEVWKMLIGRKDGPWEREASLDAEAQKMHTRFFAALPGELDTAIRSLLPADLWAKDILAHVTDTLNTIIAMSGVETPEAAAPLVPHDAPAG